MRYKRANASHCYSHRPHHRRARAAADDGAELRARGGKSATGRSARNGAGGPAPTSGGPRRKFKEYLQARDAFEQEASAYWGLIAEKRRGRNAKRRQQKLITLQGYVLTQPPFYSGPPRPVNPAPETEPEAPYREPKHRSVAADLLKAVADCFQWAPQRPQPRPSSSAPMRASPQLQLTREQAVRVYAFETGGEGRHDSQSGLIHGSRAVSTAIGYNQLLTTNTVELLAEQGPEFKRR